MQRTACGRLRRSEACGVSTGEHGHARYIARAHCPTALRAWAHRARALLACAYLCKDLGQLMQRTARWIFREPRDAGSS